MKLSEALQRLDANPFIRFSAGIALIKGITIPDASALMRQHMDGRSLSDIALSLLGEEAQEEIKVEAPTSAFKEMHDMEYEYTFPALVLKWIKDLAVRGRFGYSMKQVGDSGVRIIVWTADEKTTYHPCLADNQQAQADLESWLRSIAADHPIED